MDKYMEFEEKMLRWKPVFGDKNNKEIIRLRAEYEKAVKANDDDLIYQLQKKLEFYIK